MKPGKNRLTCLLDDLILDLMDLRNMDPRNNPFFYLTARLWEYSRGNRRNVVLYFTMFIFSNAAHLSAPLIMGLFFNSIQQSGVNVGNLPNLLWLLGLLLVREPVFWLFHGPARVIENENAFQVRIRYKQRLFDGILAMPLEWHSNHHSGDTIDKIEKGTSRLFSFAESSFETIKMFAYPLGAILVLFYFDLVAGVIATVMLILTLVIIAAFDVRLTKQYRQLNRFENKISEKIVDVITNISTVIILRIQKLLSKSVANKMAEPYELYRENIRLNEMKWFLVSLNTKIMIFLVVSYYLCSQVWAGKTVLLGTVYILFGYADTTAEMFYHFASLYGNVLRWRASVANAEELSKDFKTTDAPPNSPDITAWKELRIQSLTFMYDTGEENGEAHLEDVDFLVRRGEKVALIGATGSGKSTLLKVMRELYHPQNVRVLLDGQLLPDGFNSISPEITLIPQEPEIFGACGATILENITQGVEYDMDTVTRYTDMARFTTVAESLPKGFASVIRERGVNLSGGERQRLALARGLLACQGQSLVLLDEPTSSVDITNELKIYENIFNAFRDKAVVSSVHHLHLLPMFDRIYLFANGRVIASGTFYELLDNCSEFVEMWQKYQQTATQTQE